MQEITKIEKVEDNWVRVSLHGQSFMYNQIRKMVGMMIETMVQGYEPAYIENSFCNNKLRVPLAPSEGLLLDRLLFTNYNTKSDISEKLELSEREDKQTEEFKAEVVYREVVKAEEEGKVFSEWLKENRETWIV